MKTADDRKKSIRKSLVMVGLEMEDQGGVAYLKRTSKPIIGMLDTDNRIGDYVANGGGSSKTIAEYYRDELRRQAGVKR